MIPENVIRKLRGALNKLTTWPATAKIVERRDEVVRRFGPVYSLDRVRSITEKEFHSFRFFKSNHHWKGLHRPRICSDIGQLRDALATLLDDRLELAGDSANN